ncbi:MAG: hypothetical protein EOO81_10820 [Oxalobacteraceae bacterium]|nr:MAG: hypothetical protein EOO81_10820 [Oxalobacteraceae bacterium]
MATTLGSKFANISPFQSNLAQLIAPASNVNGVVIRTASIHVGAAYAILSTGIKAPSGYSDLTVPVILSSRGTEPGSGLPGAASVLPYEIQIPAGYGVWFAKGPAVTGTAYITYDLVA